MQKNILIFLLVVMLLVPIQAQDHFLPELDPITADNFTELELLQSWGRGRARQFDWSPDGETFVVTNDMGLWLYDVNNPTREPRLITAENYPNERVGFASATIAVTLEGISSDQNVRVWNLETGESHRIIQGRNDIPSNFAVQPGGDLVAVPTRQPAVELWHIHTGEQIAVLEGFEIMPYGIDFSPDGSLLAVDDGGQRIHLWDSHTFEHLGVLTGDDSGISLHVMFSADGQEVIAVTGGVGNATNTVRVWDVSTQQERLSILIDGNVREAGVSANGDIVLKGDRNQFDHFVEVRDLTTGDVHFELDLGSRFAEPAGFSPDGDTVIVSINGALRAWDVPSGEEVPTFSHVAAITAALSPDSQHIGVVWANNLVELIRLSDGPAVQQWLIPKGGGGTLLFNSDGSQVFYGGWDGEIFIWDTQTGLRLFTHLPDSNTKRIAVSNDFSHLIQIDTRAVTVSTIPETEIVFTITGTYNVAWLSAKNTTLMTIDDEQNITIWDINTGRPLQEFTPTLSGYPSVNWIEAGERVAIMSSEATGTDDEFELNTMFELWNVESGEQIRQRKIPGEWYAVKFDDDARFAVLSGTDKNFYEAILIWNLETDDTTLIHEGITGGAATALNNQGDVLAYGSGTGSFVWLRDVTHPETQTTLWTGAGSYGQQFSSDDTILITITSGGMVRLWGVLTPDL